MCIFGLNKIWLCDQKISLDWSFVKDDFNQLFLFSGNQLFLSSGNNIKDVLDQLLLLSGNMLLDCFVRSCWVDERLVGQT
jgi:hypothetical protein